MSLYRELRLALELLRHIDPAKIITCRCCFGSQPEPQYCGCGGNQTVAEAIAFYESQLEILSE